MTPHGVGSTFAAQVSYLLMMTPQLPASSAKISVEFIALLAMMMSMTALSIDAILPAFDSIRADIPMSNPNQVQLMVSLLFFGLGIGQLVSGPCSDALGRKSVLYAGLALFSLGISLCFFAQNLTTLLIGRFIQGLGISGPYIATVSIVRDKFVGRQMAKIMSMVMMIFITVPALAPSVGQTILLFANWRMIFLFYFCYAIILGLWIYVRLEETLPAEKRIVFSLTSFAHAFKSVINNRVTTYYTLAMGLMFGSFIGYLNSSQQIFQDLFSTGKLFTLYFGGLALILGLSSLFNSKFVEKLGMHFISRRAILSIISCSMLFLLIQFFVPVSLGMFVGYAVLLFFCFGLVFGNLNAIAMEPMGRSAGMAAALIGATSSILSMSLGTSIGQAYNHSTIPLTCGFIILPSLALMMTILGNKK